MFPVSCCAYSAPPTARIASAMATIAPLRANPGAFLVFPGNRFMHPPFAAASMAFALSALVHSKRPERCGGKSNSIATVAKHGVCDEREGREDSRFEFRDQCREVWEADSEMRCDHQDLGSRGVQFRTHLLRSRRARGRITGARRRTNPPFSRTKKILRPPKTASTNCVAKPGSMRARTKAWNQQTRGDRESTTSCRRVLPGRWSMSVR